MSSTRIDFRGHAQGTGKGFEGRLNNVMRVDPIQLPDMQRHLRVIHHCHKKLAHELRIVGTDALGWDLQAVAEVRSSRKIERHCAER